MKVKTKTQKIFKISKVIKIVNFFTFEKLGYFGADYFVWNKWNKLEAEILDEPLKHPTVNATELRTSGLPGSVYHVK